MIWNNGKSNRKLNVILALVAMILVLVLGMVLLADHRSTSSETEKLTELAEKEKKGIEDYEGVKKRAAELAEQSDAEDEEVSDTERESEAEEQEDEETSPSEKNDKK